MMTSTNGSISSTNELRVYSEEAFDEQMRQIKSGAVQRSVLVQFSAPWCRRCPPITSDIQSLTMRREFEWIYVNVADTRFAVERFELSQLPAVVIYANALSDEYVVHQGVTVQQLDQLTAHCPSKLVFDEDF